MGISDDYLKPRYRSYLKSNLSERKNLKVAWLGQQDPNYEMSTNVGMFHNLKDLFVDCIHHFYDIENKRPWDVHDKWVDIKGYDLVLCLRLTYLVQSSYHLLREMKKTAESNKTFISDFVSGNIQDGVMSWKSDNLVCYLPEYYSMPTNLEYSVTDKDHLLTKEMLNDNFLEINSHEHFIDPKNRHYIIGKVSRKWK